MTQTTPQSPASPAAPATERPIIKSMSLVKVFKDFWLRDRVRAVDGVDFEVRRGEVFGLLGPNGSGKSTTIKILLGLLHPTAGRVAVFGKRPEDVDVKSRIGYLPEESYLYPFLNARETLDYYGRLFHYSATTRERRIKSLLEQVGLEAVERRPVGEFSKGMQRRIGLAQALINDPQLLILDEPTTGMDPIGTRQIKDLILRLKQRGKTILLCSHLLADVEDVCDRVAIMYGGKIREMGTINELLLNEQETTLHTQRLSQAEIERIQELLTSWGKSANAQQPRQKLEDKFLDIVEQAQKEGLATSGARAGGRIAEFLTGSKAEPQKQEARGKRLLDQLTQEAPSPPREPAEPEPTPQTAPESRTDQGVLQSLTQDDSPEQPEPRSHQEAEPMEAQAEKGSQERDKPEPDRGLLDRLTKGS